MHINKSIKKKKKKTYRFSFSLEKASWASVRAQVSCRMSVFCVTDRTFHFIIDTRTRMASQLCLSIACITTFIHEWSLQSSAIHVPKDPKVTLYLYFFLYWYKDMISHQKKVLWKGHFCLSFSVKCYISLVYKMAVDKSICSINVGVETSISFSPLFNRNNNKCFTFTVDCSEKYFSLSYGKLE